MATILLSREQVFSSPLWSHSPQDETGGTLVHFSHWNRELQAGLLASLAVISQSNRGWILVVNAPARLSRSALTQAGIDPARVIDAKRMSGPLLQRAVDCAGIAAVVCWQPARAPLPTPGHRRQNLFMIHQHDTPPALH